MSGRMQVAPVEVFRSLTREACDDRAFMLSAVNIPSEIVASVAGYSVYVAHPQGALAAHHLWQYEQEMRRRQLAAIPAPPSPQHPDAWVGTVFYVVLLVLIALVVVKGWGRADLFTLGELDSARVQQGQWWRALTALTLHLDIAHLVSNLGAGAAFGYLASRQIGAGTAWLLIVLAAGSSNFIEAWLGTTSHRSVGASTAVFAALGLLAAHAWRTRLSPSHRWARRWAPLVAGVVLLGLLGSGAGQEPQGDIKTNLVAHALGFAMGAALGVAAALPSIKARLSRMPQGVAGAIAFALPVLAWWLAVS
jgi:rhomboid protease GluP